MSSPGPFTVEEWQKEDSTWGARVAMNGVRAEAPTKGEAEDNVMAAFNAHMSWSLTRENFEFIEREGDPEGLTGDHE